MLTYMIIEAIKKSGSILIFLFSYAYVVNDQRWRNSATYLLWGESEVEEAKFLNKKHERLVYYFLSPQLEFFPVLILLIVK